MTLCFMYSWTHIVLHVACVHTCYYSFIYNTNSQAFPCQRSTLWRSHAWWQPATATQTSWVATLSSSDPAMGTRIVNMWEAAGGMLLLRTNKISIKSHLQTAPKYKCAFAIKVLTSWNITERNWKKADAWCRVDVVVGGGRQAPTDTHACGQR